LGPSDVLEFYGHGAYMGDVACFSNFFDQTAEPFDFEVPAELCAVELPPRHRRVSCAFSEKAIMMCKAAAMGDCATYVEICDSPRPSEVKALGRKVQNFSGELWDRIVCSVAFHSVLQKFQQSPRMRKVLLGTGDRVIAEATSRDNNWGIGIDIGDPLACQPAQWKGTNILGWALMEVRTALRCGKEFHQAAPLAGAGVAGPSAAPAAASEAAAKLSDGGAPRPAFLLCHGSFNPVHRHHFEMMVAARACLEKAGFRVVRGLLAITHGRRMAHKGVAAVSDVHRLAALRRGCEAVGAGWLAPEPRGVEYGSGGRLAQGLRSELLAEEPGAVIFKLVGADTALRYTNELRGGPTVVIGREGCAQELLEAARDAEKQMRAGELFVVDELSGEECSSTKLRAALAHGDGEAVRRMCPEAVAEYLLAHKDVLYEDSKAAAQMSAQTGSVEVLDDEDLVESDTREYDGQRRLARDGTIYEAIDFKRFYGRTWKKWWLDASIAEEEG